jgi:hypothetical protein
MVNISGYLKELGLKPNDIKVYLALTELGESPASVIAKKADMPRTTVLSILEKLAEDHYVTMHHYRGTTYFWVESPFVFRDTLLHKVDVATDLGALLRDAYRSEPRFPHAEVYDTRTSIRSAIEKTLADFPTKHILYTIDSPHEGNYAKIYSAPVEGTILKYKKKRNITTHTLVPHGTPAVIEKHKVHMQDIVIKEMPKVISFSGSVWLLPKSIAFFSGTPPLLVTIEHKAIVSGIKGIFDFLWATSAPVTFKE